MFNHFNNKNNKRRLNFASDFYYVLYRELGYPKYLINFHLLNDASD